MNEDITRKLISEIDALKARLAALEGKEYSAMASLQANNQLGMVTGRMPTADQVRGHNLWASVVEDWPSTTLPDGWTWAGSPFVTPPSIQIIGSTILVATGYTSASRSYLYRSVPGGTNLFAGFYLQSVATTYVGIRLDDGTDNNYAEAVLRMDASSHIAFVQMRYRTGGGTVNEIAPANMQGNWLLLTRAHINFNILGTQWTSWGFKPNLRTTYGTIYPTNNVSGLTWTPTRAGIVIQSSSFNWEKFGVDWTSF